MNANFERTRLREKCNTIRGASRSGPASASVFENQHVQLGVVVRRRQSREFRVPQVLLCTCADLITPVALYTHTLLTARNCTQTQPIGAQRARTQTEAARHHHRVRRVVRVERAAHTRARRIASGSLAQPPLCIISASEHFEGKNGNCKHVSKGSSSAVSQASSGQRSLVDGQRLAALVAQLAADDQVVLHRICTRRAGRPSQTFGVGEPAARQHTHRPVGSLRDAKAANPSAQSQTPQRPNTPTKRKATPQPHTPQNTPTPTTPNNTPTPNAESPPMMANGYCAMTKRNSLTRRKRTARPGGRR